MLALLQIIDLLISVVTFLVIAQFILGLLIAFNVVNFSNDFVRAIYTGLNALMEPMLRPIRKIMPDTGQIDFSPMVLIILLYIVRIIVENIARSMLY